MSDRDSGVSGITRSFAGLAAGEAAARGIAFIGTLLVARRLGPSMYGIIGVASGILLYCQQVADAGIELSGVPAVARIVPMPPDWCRPPSPSGRFWRPR